MNNLVSSSSNVPPSSDRGYTSDSEISSLNNNNNNQNPSSSTTSVANIIISSAFSDQALNRIIESPNRRVSGILNSPQANQYKIDLDDVGLGQHGKKAFVKSCETLNFLIRDMAHINIQNFESCIHCLRTFVEACVVGDHSSNTSKKDKNNQNAQKTGTNTKRQQQMNAVKQQKSMPEIQSRSGQRSISPTSNRQDSDEDDDQLVTSYETISTQLLDLLDTLHIKAATVFSQWAEEQQRISHQSELVDSAVSNLWSRCWCPILQGIARLCCDTNGEVRMHALQYLQRALLVHELQTLSAMEWEACFNKVLFPLLAKLLENIDPRNSIRMEETRMRASTLLCKVFLQHLTTLARLSTFTALWLTILDYMDKYMKSDKSDLLHDVIPESLKNMLLVMETTGLFNQNNSNIKFSQLCVITKDRIESFLPGLWEDLFKANGGKCAENISSSSNQAPSQPPVSEHQNPETVGEVKSNSMAAVLQESAENTNNSRAVGDATVVQEINESQIGREHQTLSKSYSNSNVPQKVNYII